MAINKKSVTDFIVQDTRALTARYQLIKLKPTDGAPLEGVQPGQFVQIKIDNSQSTYLRRPISVHDVDLVENVMSILVCRVGAGTDHLCNQPVGSIINMIWPLGNGFKLPQGEDKSARLLLAGGGVGVAPLLYLGKVLKAAGYSPEFLLAARTGADLLQIDEFSKYGTVHLSTDDGSLGEKGLITQNKAFGKTYDHVYCCGPAPMMKAVARSCEQRAIDCQVSLENMMACGVGACLCCVEKTVKGNRCVCTEGPVFNIKELTW